MVDHLEGRIADKRRAILEHHAFVFVGKDIAQAFRLQVEIAIGRMPVKARPMRAIVHQEAGCGAPAAHGATAEIGLALEHRGFEAGAGEITGNDRSVMAATDHHRVVSYVTRHGAYPFI